MDKSIKLSIKISAIVSTVLSFVLAPFSLTFLGYDDKLCLKFPDMCFTKSEIISGFYLHFAYLWITSSILIFIIAFLIKNKDNLSLKLKKCLKFMLIASLALLILWLVITFLDYHFCPPEILDIVFTCHDEIVLLPSAIIITEFLLLLTTGLLLFFITSIILRRNPKK